MKAGILAWLICSALCITSFAYGELALSAYFLILSFALPPYIAKERRRRERQRL
jgi:hypothetical protein